MSSYEMVSTFFQIFKIHIILLSGDSLNNSSYNLQDDLHVLISEMETCKAVIRERLKKIASNSEKEACAP